MNPISPQTAIDKTIQERTRLSTEMLDDFCTKWEIYSLALFGSVLRPDFSANSDIDCLVSFLPNAKRSLLTRVEMKHELEAITGRTVDVVSKQSVEESENWIRQREILSTARTIYQKQ